ncbi:MAG: phosphatidate cytidylyltransferase [bacterium]
MSNVTKRVLSALVLVPILLYIFFRGGWLFVLLIELAILVGVNEYYRMVEQKGLMPKRLAGTVGALLIGGLAYLGRLDYMAIGITLLAMLILADQLRGMDIRTAITGSAVTLFGVFYIGWLLSHATLLRFPAHHPEETGIFFVILALAGTFLADAGAFFTGRAYGKHKLAPLISPGKTIEGAVGGVLVGTAGVVAVKLVFDWWVFPAEGTGLPLYHCLLLGPVLVVFTIAGDLYESMIKRDAGIKDSGNVIPGHGGIMDRLDSLLLAIPITYYYLRYAVYGGLL